MNANERGQFSVQRGERSGGSISFYDRSTGDLIAHIREYTYFTSNPRWGDLPHSKHRISWQPKFISDGQALMDRLPEEEIEPVALIAALEQPQAGRTLCLSRHRVRGESGTRTNRSQTVHRLSLQ